MVVNDHNTSNTYYYTAHYFHTYKIGYLYVQVTHLSIYVITLVQHVAQSSIWKLYLEVILNFHDRVHGGAISY